MSDPTDFTCSSEQYSALLLSQRRLVGRGSRTMSNRTTLSIAKNNNVPELLAVRISPQLLRRIDDLAAQRSTMWHPVTRSAAARILLEAGMAAIENENEQAAPSRRRPTRRRRAG